MMNAYDKIYLEGARRTLARMCDFVVYDLKYDLEAFFNIFVTTSYAKRFEHGESSVVAGRSGVELAYYQWYTSLTFMQIVKYVPIKNILQLYSPYHEMDIRQFADKMNELYLESKRETNLKIRKSELGVSQSRLAELTGIPVRTIQQYEQRQNNINKAQAEYLVVLARVLCCGVEDLIEKV